MSTFEEEIRALQQAHKLLGQMCRMLPAPTEWVDGSIARKIYIPTKVRRSAHVNYRSMQDLGKHNYYGFPNEQKVILNDAKSFLLSLLDSKQTPRVHSIVRDSAFRVLKHFPIEYSDKNYSRFLEILHTNGT